MIVYLGADHRGFELKKQVMLYLAKRNARVEDMGAYSYDPDDDFPEFGAEVATRVVESKDKDPRGIVICGGGQGMAMAANRFKGIRAVVVSTTKDAKLARNDNDANVLSLSAEVFKDNDDWKKIVDAFLKTKFAGKEKYIRRNKQLDELS